MATRIDPTSISDELALRSLASSHALARLDSHIQDTFLAELEESLREIARRRWELEGRAQGTRAHLLRVQRELGAALQDAYSQFGRALRAELIDLTGFSIDDLTEAVEDVVPEALGLSLSRPAPTEMVALVDGTPIQGRLLSDWFQNLEGSTGAAYLSAIRDGITSGDSSQRIARRLRDALELGIRQATVMARTAVSHVHSEAREAAAVENLDVLGEVVAVVTLDERTCDICGPRDGLRWTMPDHRPIAHSEPWDGGPGQWHYQCRCTRTYVLRDVGDLRDAGLDVDRLTRGERASVDGPVDLETRYDEWLRRQPRARQERILGKARAAWWRARPGTSLRDAWSQRFGGRRADPSRASLL